MINWILAFLGIAIFFVAKYARRTNKTKPLSFTFWISDNWPETIVSSLFTIVLMILFTSKDPVLAEWLDKWTGFIPIQIKAVGAGLFNSIWGYALFKTKVAKP